MPQSAFRRRRINCLPPGSAFLAPLSLASSIPCPFHAGHDIESDGLKAIPGILPPPIPSPRSSITPSTHIQHHPLSPRIPPTHKHISAPLISPALILCRLHGCLRPSPALTLHRTNEGVVSRDLFFPLLPYIPRHSSSFLSLSPSLPLSVSLSQSFISLTLPAPLLPPPPSPSTTTTTSSSSSSGHSNLSIDDDIIPRQVDTLKNDALHPLHASPSSPVNEPPALRFLASPRESTPRWYVGCAFSAPDSDAPTGISLTAYMLTFCPPTKVS